LDDVHRMIMVSPPVAFMDFAFFGQRSRLRLLISGSEDDIAPPSMLQDMLPVWNRQAIFKVIQGADHFHWGRTQEITSIIRDWMDLEG